MDRVIRFFHWQEQIWQERGKLETTTDTPLSEGRYAYAARQASLRKSLGEHFSALWVDIPSFVMGKKTEILKAILPSTPGSAAPPS